MWPFRKKRKQYVVRKHESSPDSSGVSADTGFNNFAVAGSLMSPEPQPSGHEDRKEPRHAPDPSPSASYHGELESSAGHSDSGSSDSGGSSGGDCGGGDSGGGGGCD